VKRYIGSLVLVAAVYYGAGRIGLELAYLDGAVAALWPPAGLGLAVLFLYGVRLWPAIVVGDLLLGDYSTPLGTVLAQTFGNTVALVVAALLLRRLTGGRSGLERVADVVAFVACALVAALVSAAFGPLALRLGDVISADEFGEVFRTWTLGDAAGVLVVAPVILAWASAGLAGIGRREQVEGGAVLVLLIALSELPPQRDVPYIVFPVLLWAAVRFGPRGRCHRGPRRLLDHRLEHGAERRAVRPRLDHRQPVGDAAVHRHLGADVAGARRGDRPSGGGRPPSWRRSPASRRRSAAWRRSWPAARRRAACSSRSPRRSRGCSRCRARASCATTASARRRSSAAGATTACSASRSAAPSTSTATPWSPASCAAAAPSGWSATRTRTATSPRRSSAPATAPAVAAPVVVGGELWGAVAAGTRSDEPLRAGVEKRLCDFGDLVAQALANADAHEQLAASRARIVEAGDAERRRLERNLHDGAQQRLVSLALDLRMIDATLEKDPAKARGILEGAQSQLSQGLDELRELARGIHPAVLTDRGLGPALEALVNRAPVPVELTELPDERLSGPVEAAAYYVVAEAVTNVPSTRAPRTSPSAFAAPTATPPSRSPTTASAGRTPAAAPACAAWRTGSRRSTATSRSTALPSAAPASAPRSPARTDGYAASGGGPLSSHSPPSRRSTPRFASRVSAAETDGRRAATRWPITSCVSRSRRWTPSRCTVPWRPASSQNSSHTRRSSRGCWEIAISVASRRDRSSARPVSSVAMSGTAHAGGPARVEHREAHRRDDPPRHLERHHLRRAVVLPGPQQVTVGQQLGAEAPADADAAHEHAVEHQQAEPAAGDLESRRPSHAPARRLSTPATDARRARSSASGGPRRRARGHCRAPGRSPGRRPPSLPEPTRPGVCSRRPSDPNLRDRRAGERFMTIAATGHTSHRRQG
jgi:integral membrane sensor domain MASE1